MLAAPELIVAERIQLLDQIEIAAELQHRMLADRMMRGEEGSEFEARHGGSLRIFLFLAAGGPHRRLKLRAEASDGNHARFRAADALPLSISAFQRWSSPQFCHGCAEATHSPIILGTDSIRSFYFAVQQLTLVGRVMKSLTKELPV